MSSANHQNTLRQLHTVKKVKIEKKISKKNIFRVPPEITPNSAP